MKKERKTIKKKTKGKFNQEYPSEIPKAGRKKLIKNKREMKNKKESKKIIFSK
jgi:hypothetical protein